MPISAPPPGLRVPSSGPGGCQSGPPDVKKKKKKVADLPPHLLRRGQRFEPRKENKKGCQWVSKAVA